MTVTDLLPAWVRYAYVHRVTRWLWERPLGAVPVSATRPRAVATVSGPRRGGARAGDGDDLGPACLLVTDSLEFGGVATVVTALCDGLPGHGIRPIVLCSADGSRAATLRHAGVEVRIAPDAETALVAIRDVGAAIAELHGAPAYLERAVVESGLPIVPVFHNTEVHHDRATWNRVELLVQRAAAVVAVSATVRDFHARHLPDLDHHGWVVVPNGAPAPPSRRLNRESARRRLGAALGVALDDDVVILCLARYDSQKNIPGTVASFLGSIVRSDDPQRLVVAGAPSDWAEYRRAESIRQASEFGDRVHLLGVSDPAVLLRACDAFLLNSFFEGWPVAATEALAAGLPLLLSDVGGARELIARADVSSALLPNPTGPAAFVDDARIGRAKRRAECQQNAREVALSIRRVTRSRAVPIVPLPDEALAGLTVEDMTRAHADVLNGVMARGTQTVAGPCPEPSYPNWGIR